MKRLASAIALAAIVAVAAPAFADDGKQLGKIGGAIRRADQFRELQITDAEEQQLGATVSEKMRQRYGVVQNRDVHRYVTLLGSVLGQASSRPDVPWTFIVLDTDAVNAFAAPGGFIHITRGALALIQDEAELAGVLGHEIIHVSEKHTVRALQKSKTIQLGTNETLSGNAALLNRLADNVYQDLIEKGFGRAEENESDEKGLVIANTVGYAPQGLERFLTRLQERNKGATEKRGLFASHPEMKQRLDRIATQIKTSKLLATATVADRYRKNISYKPVAQTDIAMVEEGAAGLTGSTEKPPAKAEEKKEDPPKKRGFGLGKLLPTGGSEQKTAQVSASGGTRGVDPERNAKGGSNPKPVAVTITAADLTAFKKEGGLD
jgi:beta-barrel assembly-enhancing protease